MALLINFRSLVKSHDHSGNDFIVEGNITGCRGDCVININFQLSNSLVSFFISEVVINNPTDRVIVAEKHFMKETKDYTTKEVDRVCVAEKSVSKETKNYSVKETRCHDKIFVGGLPGRITSSEIEDFFGQFGSVCSFHPLKIVE